MTQKLAWYATWKGMGKRDEMAAQGVLGKTRSNIAYFISFIKYIPRWINHQPHTRQHDSLHLGLLLVQPGSIRHKLLSELCYGA